MNKGLACMLVTAVLFSIPLRAQDKLDVIRREIKAIEAQIANQTSRERSALVTLQSLERELGLRRTLLSRLQREQRKTQQQITTTQKDLEETELAFERRKGAMGDRMVTMYKRGRLSNWEALLSLNSLHQLSIWLKYHQRILDHDQRNLVILRVQRDSIVTQRQRLTDARNRQQKLIDEAQQETRRISQRQTRQQKLLDDVRQDSRSLQEKLNQKLAAYEEIKRLIARQKQRSKKGNKAPTGVFGKRKGSLDWPVKGRVVANFGINRDPILKTEWESHGIDIEAGDGDLIQSVAPGVVNYVTWQRSYGNIVLVDHGDDYYTVYAQLDQVLVEPDDVLEAGDVVGRLSSRQSLNGSVLHFEVWKNDQDLNPKHWLKK